MIKYKLNNYYNVNDYTTEYVKNYLNSIGINKTESFLLGPQPGDELDPYLLKNMELGIDLLHKHIVNKSKVHITVDCDNDGFTSAAMIYNYIKNIQPEVELVYSLHEEKEHGIDDLLGEVYQNKPNLCIIPDASGLNETFMKLNDDGIDILVLDHHIYDTDYTNPPHTIIINNQLSPQFTNKDLTGAGVVLKFLQAYDSRYGTGETWKKYYDLAALGIIGDVGYGGNLDNNYIIETGLQQIHNKMFQALLDKQSYSISSTTNPTKIDVAFYIVPIINGVIRMYEQTTKRNLFYGFANNDLKDYYHYSYRNIEREETYYEKIARESANLKARQDKLVNDTMERLSANIEQQGLQNNQIIIYKTALDDKNEVQKTITGLVAMKIAAKYKRPTAVLRPILINGVQHYQGSIRGITTDGFNDFRQFLLDSNLVEYCAGRFGLNTPFPNYC